MLLLGQTNNTISYHRRFSALAGATKSSSLAKSMIKDKNTPLENSGKELFGKTLNLSEEATIPVSEEGATRLYNKAQFKNSGNKEQQLSSKKFHK